MSEQTFTHFYYFLEAFVHSLLFYRGIYPSSVFEKKKFHSILVPQSRHPEINTYIKRVLKNSEPLLRRGVVRSFVLLIEDRGKIIEDYVVKVDLLDQISSSLHPPLEGEMKVEEERQLTEMEEECQSVLLKIGMFDVQMKALPEGVTWKLGVITQDDCDELPVSDALSSGQWLVDNSQNPENRAFTSRDNSSPPSIKPIKSYRNDHINLSVYSHLFPSS